MKFNKDFTYKVVASTIIVLMVGAFITPDAVSREQYKLVANIDSIERENLTIKNNNIRITGDYNFSEGIYTNYEINNLKIDYNGEVYYGELKDLTLRLTINGKEYKEKLSIKGFKVNDTSLSNPSNDKELYDYLANQVLSSFTYKYRSIIDVFDNKEDLNITFESEHIHLIKNDNITIEINK